MAGKPEEFARAAEQAAKAGEAERRALATTLAAELETNPENFDPKKLIALGRAGVEVFTAVVTTRATSIPAATDEGGSKPRSVAIQGWADLRKPETGFVAQAVLLGVLATAVATATALIAR